eukprot:346848_1
MIRNNPPDYAWIKEYGSIYTNVKSTIESNIKMHVDLPWYVTVNDSKFQDCIRKLNDVRPNDPLSMISIERKEEIQQLQQECLILWLKFWIVICIRKRICIVKFLKNKNEELFEKHFSRICNQYEKCKINDEEKIFLKFKQKKK